MLCYFSISGFHFQFWWKTFWWISGRESNCIINVPGISIQKMFYTAKPLNSEHLRLPVIWRCPFFEGLVKILNFQAFYFFSCSSRYADIFWQKGWGYIKNKNNFKSWTPVQHKLVKTKIEKTIKKIKIDVFLERIVLPSTMFIISLIACCKFLSPLLLIEKGCTLSRRDVWSSSILLFVNVQKITSSSKWECVTGKRINRGWEWESYSMGKKDIRWCPWEYEKKCFKMSKIKSFWKKFTCLLYVLFFLPCPLLGGNFHRDNPNRLWTFRPLMRGVRYFWFFRYFVIWRCSLFGMAADRRFSCNNFKRWFLKASGEIVFMFPMMIPYFSTALLTTMSVLFYQLNFLKKPILSPKSF